MPGVMARGMTGQLDVLKQLQDLDSELFRLRSEQREKPRELERSEAEVASQQAKVKAAEERAKSLQVTQKEREIELQTCEGKVAKLKGQLHQVKTNGARCTYERERQPLFGRSSVLGNAARISQVPRRLWVACSIKAPRDDRGELGCGRRATLKEGT